MASVMKAALDDLLTEYADDPELDLEGYGAQLVALFERATSPDQDASPARTASLTPAAAPRGKTPHLARW